MATQLRKLQRSRIAITQWIQWYNAERPHQALGYRSPRQFRALQPNLVA
jgi:putative transposase